jgi:PAS domain S-box-containing protein
MAVLEHLPDGFLFTDPNGQVMLTNAALERMLGRPAATLLDRPLPADLAPGVGPVIGQALEIASEPAVGEISLEDGRRILVSASAVVGEPGTVIGVVTTLRDVSRRRAAEQVKENVLTSISHEFRTPLASVVGFAALAAKTLDERLAPSVPTEDSKACSALARLADHLQRIHESGQQLEQMVNNLLDLADMAAGRLQWDMADVSPYDVIQSALSTVVSRAEEKELPIRLALAPDLPVVRGDRVRLTQVVTQLLSNAVKFTDEGEVWVLANVLRVGAGQRPAVPISLPPGGHLQISVTDTGCGIAPESLSHIFEEFFQAGVSIADRQAGIGLGLVISRQIVEHHGGHIWAESEPGVGRTFSFALPLRTRAHPAQPILMRELRRRLAAMAPEAPSLQSVLLAHADAGLQRLLEKEFRSDGLAVLTAFDGQACRHTLESKRPSLLVLDLFLPKLDALGELSLPPTLLLSAVETDDDRLRVALGEAMTGLAGVDLSLHSVPSLLALVWEAGQPEGRLLILDVDTPSLSGITETLHAQGFEPVLSHQADTSEPDQVLLEAALALLHPAHVKSLSRYRNRQRDLCTVVLVEF